MVRIHLVVQAVAGAGHLVVAVDDVAHRSLEALQHAAGYNGLGTAADAGSSPGAPLRLGVRALTQQAIDGLRAFRGTARADGAGDASSSSSIQQALPAGLVEELSSAHVLRINANGGWERPLLRLLLQGRGAGWAGRQLQRARMAVQGRQLLEGGREEREEAGSGGQALPLALMLAAPTADDAELVELLRDLRAGAYPLLIQSSPKPCTGQHWRVPVWAAVDGG